MIRINKPIRIANLVVEYILAIATKILSFLKGFQFSALGSLYKKLTLNIISNITYTTTNINAAGTIPVLNRAYAKAAATKPIDKDELYNTYFLTSELVSTYPFLEKIS